MDRIYVRIRKKARQIVFRFPPPDFYKDFSWAKDLSRQFFETDPVILQLRSFVTEHLEDDFGHGLDHAVKVTLDAGALMAVECEHSAKTGKHLCQNQRRRVRVVQCAGLLHDMKRKDKDHAAAGAAYARKVLCHYPLSAEEVEDVSQAIQNHEAFRDTLAISTRTPGGLLVSDCLYDADKFRWGPDNFTDTVWEMVSFFKTPLPKFIDLYPKGMDKLASIKDTFRTDTGKKYGPQFIDIGLAVGQELYEVIRTEFAHLL
ncbi:MAG: hypothetical protein B6245_17120 [Desulfobacteraceae bacterium 4572_88]|nr:MAG: hypothetical protein B6245_17120 [Desulfobacteraceae bacterium 4572_88]